MSGSWTAICSGFNNIAIAEVVCRQLNSSAGIYYIYSVIIYANVTKE